MKRAPMTRTKPLRATHTARASSPVFRPRRCDARKGGCGEMFTPARQMQKACGPRCASLMVERQKARTAEKAAREDRKQTRAQLEAMKSLRTLRAEAQAEFNRFIRHRDRLAGWGCICCGVPLNWGSTKPGGEVDAGHYMSRGSSIELAFDERNVNAQRKGCNRPGGTTRAQFAAGMVARYGQAVVDELEGPHDLPQLRHDDLRAIRDTYRRKANELEKLIR